MSDSPTFDYRAQLEKLVNAIEDKPFNPNQPVKVTKKREPRPILDSTSHRRYQKTGKYLDERSATFVRDEARCRVCGEADLDVLAAHHIVRVADGGSSKRQNLIVLCANHHVLADRGRLTKEYLYGLIRDK